MTEIEETKDRNWFTNEFFQVRTRLSSANAEIGKFFKTKRGGRITKRRRLIEASTIVAKAQEYLDNIFKELEPMIDEADDTWRNY